MGFGTMAAQTLRAAVRLRVVELIGDEPRPSDEIAAEAGTAPLPTLRLLRALAGLGLLREHSPGVFSATPAGTLLDPGHPQSLTAFVKSFTDPLMTRAWERLDDSVRTGEIAFDQIFGTDFFGHLARHPELSADFNTAMSQASRATAAVLPGAYDFGRFSRVTDVGGGDGTLLAAVLTGHPGLAGAILDTAEGLADADRNLTEQGVRDRAELLTGDFFRTVPEGSDLYLMKSVLHDWTDDQVVTILTHCRTALPPEGRILIVEPILPEVVDPAAGTPYLSDLNMLVNVGGRERTRTDFDEVCGRAGLAVTSVTPLPQAPPFSLIEAAAV
ncbi:methyltransferase [Streptomyces sp. NPDC006798]|uniref:methyltransferase n=1 Tax=Streptomyces sp. NPDC006798 TaxID=3155462 RepID=UPI0033CA0CD9